MGSLTRGLAYGFSIAAPVGPIGVLCIRRSVVLGRVDGLVTGLGAATADAVYGAVAAFGLTAIADVLLGHSFALHIGGGVALVLLGARAFIARPHAEGEARRMSHGAEYGSTVLLTLANPTTILSFAAAYVSFGLPRGSWSAALFVTGVFGGSALWWVILSTGAAALRRRSTDRGLAAINKASGAVIGGFGVAALLTAR